MRGCAAGVHWSRKFDCDQRSAVINSNSISDVWDFFFFFFFNFLLMCLWRWFTRGRFEKPNFLTDGFFFISSWLTFGSLKGGNFQLNIIWSCLTLNCKKPPRQWFFFFFLSWHKTNDLLMRLAVAQLSVLKNTFLNQILTFLNWEWNQIMGLVNHDTLSTVKSILCWCGGVSSSPPLPSPVGEP